MIFAAGLRSLRRRVNPGIGWLNRAAQRVAHAFRSAFRCGVYAGEKETDGEDDGQRGNAEKQSVLQGTGGHEFQPRQREEQDVDRRGKA